MPKDTYEKQKFKRIRKAGVGSPGSLSHAMKIRARVNFRKMTLHQKAGTPPIYYDFGKLLFKRCIPGSPGSLHLARRCATHTGVWDWENHL